MLTKELLIEWSKAGKAGARVPSHVYPELCNLALANLEGEEVWGMVSSDGLEEVHIGPYDVQDLDFGKSQGWTVRKFRLARVEGE